MTLVSILSVLTAALPAYLVGAIPFGLVLGRALRGIDIREHGSRNLGATNAFRVLGARIGALVFALDFAKGLFPTLAADFCAQSPWAGLAAAIAAVLGHVFPIYLGFKGGKGVATGAGALAALAPAATGIALAVFAATVAATRYVSLGSMLASVTLAAALVAIEGRRVLAERLPAMACAVVVMVVVLVRHRANIGRLIAGTEPRFRGQESAQGVDLPKVGP